MVFPSLMFQIDQGMASQLSAWLVILFSFLIYRYKKILLTFFVGLIILVISQQSHAFGYGGASNYNYPNTWQGCSIYQGCNNNFNYYGQARGYTPPVYFYPQLPYQSMWPQQNYYFPHSASPYQPADCPFCNQQQNYQQQPMFFPNSYQFQGGGIT